MTVVLVTHDVDEALFLADSILVMGRQPSRIVDQISVPDPRPRDGGSAELVQKKQEILRLLGLNYSG